MKEEFTVIGKRLPRIDAKSIVTGTANFLDDICLPRMLHGKILISPYAHARILRVDISDAEKAPGVKAVVTGKDIVKVTKPYGRVIKDELPLQPEKVRYQGDGIAAVAAETEEIAVEALKLINVDYEILPPLLDPEEAMKPDAPKIHEWAERNIAGPVNAIGGDIEKGFKEASCILEQKFVTSKVTATPMETHGSLANYEPFTDKLTVWSSTKSPFWDRAKLADTLHLPLHNIRIIKPYVGGDFGHKGDFTSDKYLAAFLSIKTQRPVKIIYTREDEFQSTRTRHNTIITSKMGFKKDGTITAHHAHVIMDIGAYVSLSVWVAGAIASRLHEVYRIPNVRTEGVMVYTNKAVSGAYRGFGNPQARFAVEQMMDIAAEELEIDPIEVRLKNTLKAGDISSLGRKIMSCGLDECIKQAAEAIGWREWRREKYRGIGIACTQHSSGVRGESTSTGWGQGNTDNSSAYLKVNEDGSVTLFTGASDVGQGLHTVLAQIVAEEIGVELEDISVIAADTDITPYDSATIASRCTTIAGNAVKVAAEDAKRQLFQIASEMLEAPIHELEAKHRVIYVRTDPARKISIAEVVCAGQFSSVGGVEGKGRIIIGRGYFDSETEVPNPRTGYGNISVAYPFAAHAVEVKVNPESGAVEILKYVSVHDCGRLINPLLAEGQLQGAIAQGLGYTFIEEMVYDRDTGRLINPTFTDYKLHTAKDIPQIRTIIVKTVDPATPLGAKGLGETGMNPTAAAIANAIYDAIGIRFKELPIKPEEILRLIKNV